MIKFQSIAYFRSRLEVLLKVRKGVYATVVDEIRREFGGKPIEEIRINNDMVLIDGPRVIIKLRLPDKQHRLAKKDGYRLLYLVYKDRENVVYFATQARVGYNYYHHQDIGYNYRLSNVCAGIGIGQMTVADAHIAHHKRVQGLYEKLLADVLGVQVHCQPADGRFDSNYWLCCITLDPDVRVQGQEDVYKELVTRAVEGAAGVLRIPDSPVTDCQPNDNVEAMRAYMDKADIEARPVWKPMHKHPVYCEGAVEVPFAGDGCGCGTGSGVRCLEGPKMAAYVNGVSEAVFKVGMCLPAGPCVTDEDVEYIVESIKKAME